MKSTIITISTLCLALTVQAQKIDVKSGSEKFSSGSQNCLTTTIYGNNLDDVQSKWKSLLKDYKNEKVKSNGNEVFGDNVLIKDWGNNPVDVYTKFEENKKDQTVKMFVAFDLGGIYLKSSDERYNSAEKMVKEFAIKTTKDALGDKVKDQEKILGKLEDNQKDLEKDNKNLKSDIESYKDKIKKAEDDTKKNEENQTKKKTEIDAQKKVVEEAKKILSKVD
jgi:hypothetical protein